MASLNKVFLIGNLTRDPQLRYLPSGTAVAEFGLAVNRDWKSQQGEQKTDVCFVDIKVWGRQAELVNQYLNKGRSVFIEGRLEFDSWEGQDGQKKSRLRVVAERCQFLGGRGAGAEEGGQTVASGAPRRATAGAGAPSVGVEAGIAEGGFDASPRAGNGGGNGAPSGLDMGEEEAPF